MLLFIHDTLLHCVISLLCMSGLMKTHLLALSKKSKITLALWSAKIK